MLLLSIFDISSTSLISISKCLEEKVIFERQSSTLAGSLTTAAAMVVIPMMAFNGVRISWLILDKNSLFAMLACSAFVIASCRIWRDRTSSVRSENTVMSCGVFKSSTR